MTARAYYSHDDQCWYVPVSTEMWQQADEAQLKPIEPCRLELHDGQLLVTRLQPQPVTWTDPITGRQASLTPPTPH
jgi:hypothetical protein